MWFRGAANGVERWQTCAQGTTFLLFRRFLSVTHSLDPDQREAKLSSANWFLHVVTADETHFVTGIR